MQIFHAFTKHVFFHAGQSEVVKEVLADQKIACHPIYDVSKEQLKSCFNTKFYPDKARQNKHFVIVCFCCFLDLIHTDI